MQYRAPPGDVEPELAGVSYLGPDASDPAGTDDARFFQRHLRRRFRLRPAFPGEFIEASPPNRRCVLHAVVRDHGAGLRVRLPVWLEGNPPDAEDIGEDVYADCIAGDVAFALVDAATADLARVRSQAAGQGVQQ